METTPIPTNGTVTHPSRVATSVALALPCEACLHAPVCRIRPEIESLRSVRIEVPRLPDGARVALSASAECDWFAKGKRAPETTTAKKASTADWTPERRAAQAERIRAVAAARKATAG